MFDETQYVIERKQLAAFLPFAKDTYNVKDVNGNLQGYFKMKRRIFGGSEFWIEGADGTRLGEIRSPKNRYEVYDAQNQLQGTIRMAPTKKEESRRFLLALILSLMPMIVFVAILFLSLVVPSFSLTESVWLILLIGGFGLTILGLILFGYRASKGRFGKPKWLIEDPEGQRLAEGNDFYLDKNLEISAPDGDVIARVRGTTISLKPSYHIDISRQGFNPLLILSYTAMMAHRHTETVRSSW